MFRNTNVKGRFINDDGFVVDFRHIINNGECLNGTVKDIIGNDNFVIEHWNKPEAKWGYYNSLNNAYYLFNPDTINQPFETYGFRVSMPYVESIKPTSAIIYPKTLIVIINGKLSLIKDV